METWLNDSIADAELGFENYNVFRVDRNSKNSKYLREGNVLVAVRKDLFRRAIKVSVSDIEQLYVDVRLGHTHVIVGTVYLPPTSDPVYESHCLSINEIIALSPNSDILIVGDYNLPNLS